ncbi:hypothetical protein KOAAANKH_03842 [Brevundimonas sp. NIBR10]|uniref:plasmid partitioning protein RepB C-terminal domain-containing protein n=1 Tax=Brevundimonas sp. NIBR10 TaxID=3015997 RepID=UPI0022F15CAA|nr:plasmid partitioning protein RepB C-terminal domain-containing protein [Brevundimonas sp. NIBR10]WGM48928.1 hypothetical protein KOAAANKH_03842 [Brevundimonas sp. NIBR10]
MTSATRHDEVKLDFESNLVTISLDNILPLKPLRPSVKESRKYAQICASIRAIGVVEPPAVLRDPKSKNGYLLLDGHLRIEALKDIGATETECLIATVDDTYTYNKRINRLTATQEHRMISRAADRGVSEERLADALGLDVSTIRRRFKMLDGICDAAVETLRDTPCPMAGFELIRCMAPVRQVEAAQLMVDQGNFSVNFVRALLLATPETELVDPRKKKPKGTRKRTAEDMGRMEREITNLQAQAHTKENRYSEINFQLTFAKGYLEKVLGRPRVSRWLAKNHPEYFEQFQDIVGVTSLKAASAGQPLDLGDPPATSP